MLDTHTYTHGPCLEGAHSLDARGSYTLNKLKHKNKNKIVIRTLGKKSQVPPKVCWAVAREGAPEEVTFMLGLEG